VRDIISSNINTMLDKAEDPEKLIKLMIREMEDTLVELRASCAGAMAQKKKVERAVEDAEGRASDWESKAQMAVDKGRDDLAREALMERRRYVDRAASLRDELVQTDALVEQYQQDIAQLEDKLAKAREKKGGLVQRKVRAEGKTRAQRDIRKADANDSFMRFENFENRIERMEAEADMVNFGRKPTLEDKFAELETDDDIEAELKALKDGKDDSAES
jgi:phage shock protein A